MRLIEDGHDFVAFLERRDAGTSVENGASAVGAWNDFVFGGEGIFALEVVSSVGIAEGVKQKPLV